VAVTLTMARMKVAVMRHSYRGQRAATAGTAAVLGAVLATGTVYLGVLSPDLLAGGLAVWLLGWMLGPVFMGGGDETLRPEYFAMLGLPSRRLATGLLAASFVGVAPLVSLGALTGLVVAGARIGPVNALVAVPAMVLQLAVFVLLSKVSVALVGLALRTRFGAILSGLVNGVLLASMGQIWVFMVAFEQTGVPAAVWYLPSGWGVLAVRGQWWALAALAALVLLLLGVWAALLSRRAGRSRVSGHGRRPIVATTAIGAVVAKELRTWSRDLVRNHQLAFAFAYGAWFAASPLIIGWDGMLPYAGPIFIVMAAAMAANVYGTDGTALWLTMMIPDATDVRGRQFAWTAVQGGIATVLTVVCTAIAGGPWPLVLALLPALLGGAAGLVPLVSVHALVPATDPHRRSGNPLRTSEDEGGLTGLAYLMLALVAVTGVPACLVALRFGWVGVPVGLVTGALCYRYFGLLAERHLRTNGPELLDTMRTGRKPQRSVSVRFDGLDNRQKATAALCAGFGAIPLFPQGIVAAVMVFNGKAHFSWFLATYAPPAWRYPVAVAFMLIGLAMYGTAAWIARPRRAAGIPAQRVAA
jgi:ABC-2 type transport system permease protein